MPAQTRSARAASLDARLRAASAALIDVVQRVGHERWAHVPSPSVWSVDKDTAHVADALAYHLWIVRLTIGKQVSSRRPAIERQEVTTILTPHQVAGLIRERTEEAAALISALTDEQLALPTRPPRARAELLANTIDRVLVGHYDVHRRAIEQKLRGST